MNVKQLLSHHTKNTKPSKQTLGYCVIPSPVGKVLLAGNTEGLQIISFQDGAHPIKPNPNWIHNEKGLKEARQQLKAYFAGKLQNFSIKLAPRGTLFQQQVWRALTNIPYGQTVSYGEIAKAIGKPKASRAVGAANGRNPLSIVVPCHRVIGGTGHLVGYGGGLKIKETLLTLEQGNHIFSKKRKPA